MKHFKIEYEDDGESQLLSSMPTGRERTAAIEKVLGPVRERARSSDHTPEDIRRLSQSLPDERTYAVIVMQENESLRDFNILCGAIKSPLSAHERYEALLLAEEMPLGPRLRAATHLG